ncbi:MAG: RidA family protein [Bdellovibrionales bacterium]
MNSNLPPKSQSKTNGPDKVLSTRAPEPVGPYPHARRVGDFIFVSGMGPRRPGTREIPGVLMDAMGRVQSYDIQSQTHSVIQNIRLVLEEMGASLADVVDVSVFLTNMKSDFADFNRIYGEYFATIGPTRTTVEVLSLPTPIAVELKVIAYRPR